jgi:predicted regulator of Ras-like GTPase activity (Roadblock/LC7/MglB family)
MSMKDQFPRLENEFRAVERILLELLERTQAMAAHLVDRGGRIVMTVGPDVEYDLHSFASLAAADVAANDELMRLFGGTQVDGVACLGTRRSMASSLVADRLVLCVVFDQHSTLGLVRHRMRRSIEKLDPLFRTLFGELGVADGPAPRAGAKPKPVAPPAPAVTTVAAVAAAPEALPEPLAVGAVPAQFGAAAAAALDDLLGDDLN